MDQCKLYLMSQVIKSTFLIKRLNNLNNSTTRTDETLPPGGDSYSNY